jgi:hypothetical protein
VKITFAINWTCKIFGEIVSIIDASCTHEISNDDENFARVS